LGLKSNGSIVAWGDNYYGQCNVPSPNRDFSAIAGGSIHSLAIRRYYCPYRIAGDTNGDCKVDLTDFAGFADNWLVDCDKDPNDFGCGVLW
jgi:hypothetical protein